MKQLATLLLALILVLVMVPAARADVIYIPDDPFLEDHMDECERVDRGFRTLTQVTVYESPESDRVLGSYAADLPVGILYSYTDARGNKWGYMESYEYENDFRGWVPMAYLELIYDYLSFDEDYGHTFRTEEWELPAQYADKEIIFWKYPGSKDFRTFDMAAWGGDWLPSSVTLYTDDQGRDWAFVGYYYGPMNSWIFVNDPTASFDTIFTEGAPEVEIPDPDTPAPTLPHAEIKPAPKSNVLLYAGITAAVGLCVGITAGALWRKKKQQR